MAPSVSVHLFGDSDDFERGFQLGVVWQLLRQGLDHTGVVLPVSLTRRAVTLAQANGYRVTIRKAGYGLRYIRFRSVQGGS